MNGGQIDYGTYTMGSNLFTASTINSITAYAQDKVAGNFPVTYTFSLTPKARVAAGSYIMFTMPIDVVPHDVNQMERACMSSPIAGFSESSI